MITKAPGSYASFRYPRNSQEQRVFRRKEAREMANHLSVNDVIFIYSKLQPIAHEMQRTRSGLEMMRDTGLSVLEALHLPVAPPAQNLTMAQTELKDFDRAVNQARNAWDGFGTARTVDLGAHNLAPTDARIVRMVSLVNYAAAHNPVNNHGLMQIHAKLSTLQWSVQDQTNCGTWPP
jgi:hypothetical protein